MGKRHVRHLDPERPAQRFPAGAGGPVDEPFRRYRSAHRGVVPFVGLEAGVVVLEPVGEALALIAWIMSPHGVSSSSSIAWKIVARALRSQSSARRCERSTKASGNASTSSGQNAAAGQSSVLA